MFRLEIKIPNLNSSGNFQVIWNDVESEDIGHQTGEWVKESYENAGYKGVEYSVLKTPVKYKYEAIFDDQIQNNDPNSKSPWLSDIQDAADYGWQYMRNIKKEKGIRPSISRIIDNTDQIRANLLGTGELPPQESINENKLNSILIALNKFFQAKFGRDVGPWKTNGSKISDITIKIPSGVFEKHFESGIRVIDVKNEGQFLTNENDLNFKELFDALKNAGRSVNCELHTTMNQHFKSKINKQKEGF